MIPVSEDEMPYYENGSFYFQGGTNLALSLVPGMAATKLAHIPRAVQFARGLTIFDSFQNAAMASRGAWDAYNNRLNLSNGLAMVGGILGLGGNAASIRQIGKVEAAAAAARGSVPRGAVAASAADGEREFIENALAVHTKGEAIAVLRGTTRKANQIADAIADNRISIIFYNTSDELNQAYKNLGGLEKYVSGFQMENAIHVIRGGKASIIVHEGVHVLDRALALSTGALPKRALAEWRAEFFEWEFRQYFGLPGDRGTIGETYAWVVAKWGAIRGKNGLGKPLINYEKNPGEWLWD